MRNLRSLCCAFLLLTLGLAYAEKSEEAGMVKSSRQSGIPSTFVPDPQGSGYMLAFPMDESGIVAAESAPQVTQVVLPEGAAEAIVEEAKKEGIIPADATIVSAEVKEDKKEETPSTEAPTPVPTKPTTSTTKAPYKPPSEADKRRKIEEMRKILGLPPTGTKPKYVRPEKPKSILPTLLLKAALPKLHDTHSRLAEMLPIPLSLMRRSDSGDSQGAGPRIAALSNILQTASAFMRRAILEDEADVQNVRGGKRNPKSKNNGKDNMLMMLDEDKLKNIFGGKDDEDDDDDDLPFIPFPRPFPVPFRLPFGRGPSQQPMPFGLPRYPSMGPMGPRRMPPMIQSRSLPRIPMHANQYPSRPVPFHQQMMPSPFHLQAQLPMHHPMHAQSAPFFAPYPQPQQQIILMIPQRAPQPAPQHPQFVPQHTQFVPQHSQFVPQHYPVPMAHSMHYDQMQAANHHVPSPVQPVLVMLHPMAVPQPMYRQQVQYRAPQMEYRNTHEEEVDERELGDDSNDGPQDSPRYVMLVDNSVGPSPRGMPQFPQARTSQPQVISPLRKMQIIREIIMARQSMPSPRPPMLATHRQGNSIFPFHPPVPRLVPKMMAELRQKTGERLAASMLRPIFLPAGL